MDEHNAAIERKMKELEARALTQTEASKPRPKGLAHNFTYHPPKPEQIEVYGEVRQKALEYAEFLTAKVPQSRELSLALTKLEEAVMWANAGIARNS